MMLAGVECKVEYYFNYILQDHFSKFQFAPYYTTWVQSVAALHVDRSFSHLKAFLIIHSLAYQS